MNTLENLDKYRNHFVYWMGGGYDGCIQEPNFGFIDDTAEFVPVISTGCGAIKDTWALLNILNEGWSWGSDVNFLPINQKNADKLQHGYRIDFVAALIDAINDHDLEKQPKDGYELSMVCTNCGKHFISDEMSFSDIASEMIHEGRYRGDGGIGLIPMEMMCDACQDEELCDCCGEHTYNEGDEPDYIQVLRMNGIITERYCEDCLPQLFKQGEDDLEELSDMYDEIDNERINIKEMLRKYKEAISKNSPEEIERAVNRERKYIDGNYEKVLRGYLEEAESRKYSHR